MSDTAIRAAERAVEADPTAWRGLLPLLLRAGRYEAALEMLRDCEERVVEAGKSIVTAVRMAEISGAALDPEAGPALARNAREVLAISDRIVALDNDLALGRYGRTA